MMPHEMQLERMNSDIHALLPKELACTVNLMAHPAGGVAAVSALGLGLAGHAFGVWMGALAGAAEASQRLFAHLEQDVPVADRPPVGTAAAACGTGQAKGFAGQKDEALRRRSGRLSGGNVRITAGV